MEFVGQVRAAISGLRDIEKILQHDHVVEHEAVYRWAPAEEMNLGLGAPWKRDTDLTLGDIPSPLNMPSLKSLLVIHRQLHGADECILVSSETSSHHS